MKKYLLFGLLISLLVIPSIGLGASFSGSRSFSAPSRSFSAPSRSFSVPTRSYTPAVKTYTAPARTYTAPTKTYTAPTRTYTPVLTTVKTPVTAIPSVGKTVTQSAPSTVVYQTPWYQNWFMWYLIFGRPANHTTVIVSTTTATTTNGK